jgi:hypothetical protein
MMHAAAFCDRDLNLWIHAGRQQATWFRSGGSSPIWIEGSKGKSSVDLDPGDVLLCRGKPGSN